MMEKDKLIATKFMDELIELGVFEECEEKDIVNNFPLFVVPKPKPEQKGEFRCIANGKTGGQNANCVPDPVQMTSPQHILGRMYKGGYSSMLDMSKYFHNFRTIFEEQKYMGVIHPGTGKFYRYVKCPMGSRNSPGGTGRFGMAFLRAVIASDDIFSQERYVENTCYNMFDESKPVYHPEHGEGRVFYSKDGTPTILLWLHVDDLLVHGPSMEKVEEAMTKITDMAMSFGMVMQPVKAVLPSQRVQYCGFLYNTTNVPTLEIPSYKLSRALSMVDYILSGSYTRLARLTLATVLGNLQSLVPATQANIGACYLRHLYTDLHNLKDSPLVGCRMYYYTSLELSMESQMSLLWWKKALELGFCRKAYPQDTGTIAVSFGDGSASGAGGTMGIYTEQGPHLPTLDFWSGVWDVCVHHFSCNWRELRTLELTFIRELHDFQTTGKNRLRHKRVFYFTDNSVTYDVCNNSTSSSPGLMQLIMNIRLLEIQLECTIVVVHVPGILMITQGSDGLSRGILPDSFGKSHIHHPMKLIFRPAQITPVLLSHVLDLLGLPCDISSWNFHTDATSWSTDCLIHSSNFWCVSPQLARQAVLQATYSYCETPLTCRHIFVIPRILIREFQRINKYYSVLGPFWDLPVGFTYTIPFVILYLPFYCRVSVYYREKQNKTTLPDELDIPPMPQPHWIQKQMDSLYGL